MKEKLLALSLLVVALGGCDAIKAALGQDDCAEVTDQLLVKTFEMPLMNLIAPTDADRKTFATVYKPAFCECLKSKGHSGADTLRFIGTHEEVASSCSQDAGEKAGRVVGGGDSPEDSGPKIAFCGEEHSASETRLTCWEAQPDYATLKQFKKLESLTLAEVPADVSFLSGLGTLKELSLRSESLADLSVLAGLGSLEALEITAPVTSLEPLAGLKQLKKLVLDKTKAKDLTPLSGLANLEELAIDAMETSDLGPLKTLTKLKVLRMNYVSAASYDVIGALTNLVELQMMAGRSKEGTTDIGFLVNLKNLEKLELSLHALKDVEPLRALTRMKELSLARVGMKSLAPIAELTSMEALDVRGNKISDIKVATAFGKLRSLNLSDTPIADLSPLSGLSELRELDVSGTRIKSLDAIASLSGLERLSFDTTAVRSLEPLSTMRELSFVSMSESKVPQSAAVALQKTLPDAAIYGSKAKVE